MRVILPNSRAYDRAGTGNHSLFSNMHCCICGRGIVSISERKWSHFLLLVRAADGRCEYAISHPAEATEIEWSHGAWIAPIGPDCLAKYPDLRRLVVGFEEQL